MADIGQRMLDVKFVLENTLTANTKRLIRFYRQAVINSMKDYLDRVRVTSAEDFIIPSANPNMRVPSTTMYRKQPSTPGKLTERTGALIKMLKDTTPWTDSARGATTEGMAMQGTIKTTTSGTSLFEEFSGELRANVRSANKYWPFYSSDLKKKKAMPTTQQLTMRFKWETGIRGGRRPFIEPAGQKEYINTERLMQLKLDQLEGLAGIL